MNGMMRELATRRMGRTGMEVKEIGLGGAWWDSAGTEADCIEAIHRALDLGIDYLDTYPELEPWWGKALAGI